jgi:hypothetical protein
MTLCCMVYMRGGDAAADLDDPYDFVLYGIHAWWGRRCMVYMRGGDAGANLDLDDPYNALGVL